MAGVHSSRSNYGQRLFVLASLQVLFLSLVSGSNGLAFEVDYGGRKCIYEEVPPSTQIKGEFHVSGGTGEMELDLFITDPRGVVYFNKQNMDTQKFSFKSGQFIKHTKQKYKFCVLHQVHQHAARMPRVKRRVSFSVEIEQSRRAKKKAQVATGSQVDSAHEKLADLEDDLDTLLGEFDGIREEEQVITDIGTNTTSTILRYSVLSIAITLLTGFLNHYYLRSFFKQKKLM